MANIRIEYDGDYPCLCMGHLKVYIDDTLYDFGNYCLSSGGEVRGGPPDLDFEVIEGDWTITEWPENFPNNMKKAVLEVINMEIPSGYCGGCI